MRIAIHVRVPLWPAFNCVHRKVFAQLADSSKSVWQRKQRVNARRTRDRPIFRGAINEQFIIRLLLRLFGSRKPTASADAKLHRDARTRIILFSLSPTRCLYNYSATLCERDRPPGRMICTQRNNRPTREHNLLEPFNFRKIVVLITEFFPRHTVVPNVRVKDATNATLLVPFYTTGYHHARGVFFLLFE